MKSTRLTFLAGALEIDALDGGEYLFRCDLHPDMIGTLVVAG